ncbi:MAG: NAD(P)H-dependent oxidoreductase [Candidatus Omnitrophica bacterium]|nr:NAD(P)H-dependent oxidoreductase [Candidatus Omnitrophota bacterium]
MKMSVILAHPNPKSFNHAIAATVVGTLRRTHHQVYFHDLYKEKFPPLLSTPELTKDCKRMPPLVRKHCREIAHADGIVVIHPNWWGQPPAILKGWMDRVLRVGVAYDFVEGDKGEGVPVGLLKAKTALVFNTSNTPPEREQEVFRDPLEILWKNCVFSFCGVKKIFRRTFSVVIVSTLEERKAWLGEVEKRVLDLFS